MSFPPSFFTRCLLFILHEHAASGQQDPLRTCRALAGYLDPNNFNDLIVSNCTVFPNCLGLTCMNSDSSRQIATLVVNFLPCGENGRKQGVQITILDFSSNTLLNSVYYDNQMDVPIGDGTKLGIRIQHHDQGINFGVILVLKFYIIASFISGPWFCLVANLSSGVQTLEIFGPAIHVFLFAILSVKSVSRQKNVDRKPSIHLFFVPAGDSYYWWWRGFQSSQETGHTFRQHRICMSK